MKTHFSILLFLLLPILSFAQKENLHNRKKSFLGIETSVSGENMVGYLFRSSLFKEKVQVTNRIGLNYTYRTAKNWEISIATLWKQSTRVRTEQIKIPFRNPDQSNLVPIIVDYNQADVISTSNYRLSSLVRLTGEANDLIEEELYNVHARSVKQYSTISFPIGLAKIFPSNQKIDWYLGFRLSPNILTGYTKRRRTDFNINEPDKRFSQVFSPRVEKINLVDSKFLNQEKNIQSIYLSSDLDIGFIYHHFDRKSKIYLGLFYGESLTPFTKVENENYRLQYFGLKMRAGLKV